jgi:hypothetical protein
MGKISYREKAMRLSRTQIGVTEKPPGSNRGPEVDKYQEYTDAGGYGFPWCAAFVCRNLSKAGFDVKQIKNRASVGFFLSWARGKGYVVKRPYRGDLVCYKFDHDSWPDHIGHVERVLSLRPLGWFLLQTVEGNTSFDSRGSQSNGGAVARKRRMVKASSVDFIRIPGMSIYDK